MKKTVLFLFVILAMMCSAQVKANTLMVHGLIWVSTNVDNELHLAEATIWEAPSGYNVYVGCPSLGVGYSVCYASVNINFYSNYFYEVCELHNSAFPTSAQMHFNSISVIDYFNPDA